LQRSAAGTGAAKLISSATSAYPITPHGGDPYVPVNMPAIGDLFDMFDFPRD